MSVNRETPNPLSGGKPPKTSRPTSTAACGSAPGSGTGGHGKKVSRVLRVQVRDLSHEDWLDLLLLSRESARFCNATMADYYARELGYAHPDGKSVFVRMKQRLSGDVRVALGGEVRARWRMNKKDILSGKSRVAEFTEKRALVCRGEHMDRGKRKRHAWIWSDGTDHYLNVGLVGKDSERIVGFAGADFIWGRRGERHQLKLWWKPQVDERHRPLMESLAIGETRLLKVSLVFERPGRKVFALLTYEKFEPAVEPGSRHATLGPLEPDGSLWLRIEKGPRKNYTDWVHRLIAKKEHWAGLTARIRARTRRTGKGHRQKYRSQLLKAGSFTAYAHGQLHELSALIVKDLTAHGVGYLTVAPVTHQDLPMAELVEKLTYKADAEGITIERLDPKQEPTMQALESFVSRRERSLAAKKRALRVLREKEAI